MAQLRLFDGQAVDLFSARISGAFDIDEDDVGDFGLDETVVMIVVAQVNGGSVKKLASGDLQRINTLGVTAMRVASGDLRTELLDMLGISRQEKLPLPTAATAATTDVAEDEQLDEQLEEEEVYELVHVDELEDEQLDDETPVDDDVEPPRPVDERRVDVLPQRITITKDKALASFLYGAA